jgi:integrase
MPADITLDKYVQSKLNRGRQFFYFRVAPKDQKEFRRALPHPFDDGYRVAYNTAHAECFGNVPLDLSDPHGWDALITEHRHSSAYKKLGKNSKGLREQASALLSNTFGDVCVPSQIKPLHMQALYDKLSARPATANRRMDDMSKIFAWGRLRGFNDINPCSRIERVHSTTGYEPWPMWALEKMMAEGKPHIVQAVLAAIYTGQRRADCLTQLRPAQITDGVWLVQQGKTKTPVPVPLHPVILALLDVHNDEMHNAGRIDPTVPILKTSRGAPWSSGFGASWAKELERLELHEVAPRLTFHGLRTTNATMVANAVAKSDAIHGGIAHVQAMMGHLSKAMSEHYARRAVTEHMNAETILLLPTFGNQPT